MSVLKVHVEFLDGRPAEDHEMPAPNYGPGQEQAVCMQLLAAIHQMGLVLFSPDGALLIPISSIKSVQVTVPSVVVANAGDLAGIAAAAGNRIKL